MMDEFKEEVRLENEKKKLEGNKLGANVTNGKAVSLQLEAERDRSLNGGDKKSELKNSAAPISQVNKVDVRSKLAKTAGVSTDTYSKGKKILDSDNEELKQEVLS